MLTESNADAGLQAAIERVVSTEPSVAGVMACVRSPKLDLSWIGASGVDNRTARTPLSASRSFRIASVTKLFVAATVFRLQEEGRVSLRDPIDTLLSATTLRALKKGGYDATQITVAQLLSHTSGLQDHASSQAYLSAVLNDPQRRWSRNDQIELAMSLGQPLFEPGKAFQYSDTGFVILGEIIEGLADDPLAAVVRSSVNFASLGLNCTYWEKREEEPPETAGRAHQYIGGVDARAFHPSLDLYGGGGLVSTLSDLIVFNRALFSGQLFRHANTLAAGLIVPRGDRPKDSHVHSYLGMVLSMGRTMGWGHLGFWGCGVAWCPATDLSVSLSINQAQPSDKKLTMTLFAELGNVVSEQSR